MKKQLMTILPDRLTLGGEDFYLASGDFHYFRTLTGGWRYRLKLMKAFGLTAVQTYVPWDLHEPEKGKFCFEGNLDLKAFLEMCAEEGLYVMLRPAPYICSECDFGGLPYWLLKEDGVCPRTSDESYLAHCRAYTERLCREIVPMLSTNGGPVIAVALENEYGSFGMDLEYLRELGKMYREFGIDVPFFTAGGPDMYKQIFGGFPEIWSCIDLRSNVPAAVKQLRRFQQDFPVYVSEFWGGCAMQWGGVPARQSAETVAKNYREALETGAYVNFYMFCGGTSFGFFSGANHSTYRLPTKGEPNRFMPFTTSYDTDAPVSEDGTPTEKYFKCREALAAWRGMSLDELPPVPEKPPVQTPEEIVWEGSAELFDPAVMETVCEKRVKAGGVRSMESLDQDYGYILYRTKLLRTDPDSSYILYIDGLHDRADIFIDGVYRATYYRERPCEPLVFDVPGKEAQVDILVENLGRICYGYHMLYEKKGILGCVRLDVKYKSGGVMYNRGIVMNWEIFTLPLRDGSVARLKPETPITADCAVGETGPRFFRGHFAAKPGEDAFLRFRGGVPDGRAPMTKGAVWVNGFPLGRYWAIGPQDTLYIPGELLRENNTILVFEQYAGGRAPGAVFSPEALLDSIRTNAELTFAPQA